MIKTRTMWLIALGFLLMAANVQATAQFTRKYGVSCSDCHSVFPRLNQFGELFMANGYQMPGSEDGDEVGKNRISDRLNIDQIENYLGIRLSVSPVIIRTNSRTESGDKKTELDFGNPDWLQIFTGGSIFKNVSIFIETEVNTAEELIENNWFKLGFHNLFGSSLFNIGVGKQSMMEWHAVSGRLRAIPNIKYRISADVKSSNGKGEDSVSLGSGVPSIDLHGNKGIFWYDLGISNGAKLVDPNDGKNFYGTLKLEAQEGDFGGSAISVWGMTGIDTFDSKIAQIENDFWRISPAANIRYGKLDVLGGYWYGNDDNFLLEAVPIEETIFHGVLFQINYLITPQWFGGIQYDYVTSDDTDLLDYNKISPSVWYIPRENMRIGIVGRIDVQEEDKDHPDKIHEVLMNIRTMF